VNPGTENLNAAHAPVLIDETSTQHRRFTRAFELMRQGVAERVFPGAALAVVHRGRLLASAAFGRFTYEEGAPEVRPDTAWDLASLTKPIATTSVAMLLCEHVKLALDAPVADYLPEFAVAQERDPNPGWRRKVTIAMLLAHSSGLPAHRTLYEQATGAEAILNAARGVPLEAEPGTRAEYSDIGFIILGELIGKLIGEGLDSFCHRELFLPVDLNFMFLPTSSQRAAIPPTVDDRTYRRKIIQGEVNDENAWAMGGVAGHAGLFGDALSVARFAELMLRGGSPLFRRDTVEQFTRRQPAPMDTSRTLGWDTPSAPSQSGSRFTGRSFGHLGYTGTSLWCDAERQLSVTLLSNRTWPNSDNQAIKQLRPRLHDAIVGALDE